MHAGPLITTPSALLLFSHFVSPVLSSSYFCHLLLSSCPIRCFLFLFPLTLPLLLSRPLCRYIFSVFFLLFISRSDVNILSCAQTPA